MKVKLWYSVLSFSIAVFLSSRSISNAGAERFEASELLDSILDEVFIPCVDLANLTGVAPAGNQPPANDTAHSYREASVTYINESFVNEFGFCVPYEPGQGLCDNFLSADDYVFIPFERQSLRIVQEAVDGAFSLFTLLPDTECFRAALAMFCYHYFIPCTSSPGSPGLPRPLCLDECITVSIDRCADEWNTGLTFVAADPQLLMLGLGLPDCCNLTRQIGPVHNCCQPLGEFQRESLSPSYQVCFPDLKTVAPTKSPVATVIVSSQDLNITAIVAGTVSAAAVLILIIIILVISFGFSISLWRRTQRKKKWDAHSVNTHATNSLEFNASCLTSGRNGHAHAQGQLALRRVKTVYRREFESSNLIIPMTRLSVMETVGQGEFGAVQKGVLLLDDNGSQAEHLVAVKTLKDVLSQEDMDKFLEESLHMTNFNHLNVLNLLGICIDSADSPMLVMPYMEHGSLLSYLRKKREYISVITANEYVNTITECSLLSMCLQIARGMEYLAGLRFVHRDLAARNCMIDGDYNVKVADFGLTKDVYDRNYYRAIKSEKVPARWMPLESLVDGVWSEKSDVWSFGITCWEVFTFGHIPYPGVDVFSIVQFLEKGERLQKPSSCQDDMFGVMLGCWADKPDNRLSFKVLVDRIGNLLSSRAGYLDLHIDKALAAAEELSASAIEYSYIDPDRMFRIIQSLRTSQNKCTSDYPPSPECIAPEASESSYTGLKTESRIKESSNYCNDQPQNITTSSQISVNSPLSQNHKISDIWYTHLQLSSLDQDREYTTAMSVNQSHHMNSKLKVMYKVGSTAGLITHPPRGYEDFTASGYVNASSMP